MLFEVIPKRGSIYDTENDIVSVYGVNRISKDLTLFLVYFSKSSIRKEGWQWVASRDYKPYIRR